MQRSPRSREVLIRAILSTDSSSNSSSVDSLCHIKFSGSINGRFWTAYTDPETKRIGNAFFPILSFSSYLYLISNPFHLDNYTDCWSMYFCSLGFPDFLINIKINWFFFSPLTFLSCASFKNFPIKRLMKRLFCFGIRFFVFMSAILNHWNLCACVSTSQVHNG